MLKPWSDDRLAANGRAVKDNFADWFESSKVTFASGSPLLVYHGTDADIFSFDNGKLGTATGSHSSTMGHFFVSKPEVAVGYAHHAATHAKVQQALKQADLAEAKAQRTNKQSDWDAYDKAVDAYQSLETEVSEQRLRGQNVLPVYLSIQNPIVFDAKGAAFADVADEINAALRKAKRAGHDGAILRNLDDAAGRIDLIADHYVAFDSSQIKSAIGNSGLYLRNSKSMTDVDEALALELAHQAKLEIPAARKRMKAAL